MENGERTTAKKASEGQRKFLIQFMERDIEFANDRFESPDGAHKKARKWEVLSLRLNRIEGSTKTPAKWRKYWLDQKLRVKERNALLKASYHTSRRNEPKKMKELTDFENRVISILTSDGIADCNDVQEMFHTKGATVIEETSGDGYIYEPEFLDMEESLQTASRSTTETHQSKINSNTLKKPPIKRPKHPSGKTPNPSLFYKELLDIEKEKLKEKKKKNELMEKNLKLKEQYFEKMLRLKTKELDLKQREVEINERKLYLKENED